MLLKTCVYYKGLPLLGQENKFKKTNFLRWLENTILTNVAFHKRDMSLIFSAEFTEGMLDMLCIQSPLESQPWLSLDKNCQNEGSQEAGKCYSEASFYKCSKCFL